MTIKRLTLIEKGHPDDNLGMITFYQYFKKIRIKSPFFIGSSYIQLTKQQALRLGEWLIKLSKEIT